MSDPVTAAADGSPDPRSGMVAALAEVLGRRLADPEIVGAAAKAVVRSKFTPSQQGDALVELLRNTYLDEASAALAVLPSLLAAALAPTVERLVAEGRAEWPCDDYKPPLTCWTTPKPKTLICQGCRDSFPDGPDTQTAYLARVAVAEALDEGKAHGWDEAHTQFCEWVPGFTGCQVHTNPHAAVVREGDDR